MALIASRTYGYLPPLLAPVHSKLPFGLIDLYGAARLSQIINWIASGVFDPPSSSTGQEDGSDGKAEKEGGKGKGGKKKGKRKAGLKARATLLQELFGLMVVVFGGETFLSVCTGQPPSWLTNPNVALLFGGIHALQTRTPLRRFLPSKPTLGKELLLSLPDAIGRTLLLTKFSILPLLHSPSSVLPKTPTTLLLVPFILAVPFASISFSTFNLFSPAPKLETPLELRPGGWAYADSWLPVIVPFMFLSLIGPVEGWTFGLKWTEEEALVICGVFVWAVFAGKTIYNMGYKKEQWAEMFGNSKGKIKTT